MQKLTREYVEEEFKKKKINIVGEYVNSTTAILCEQAGYMGYISYHNFKNGKKLSLFGVRNLYCCSNVRLFCARKDPSTQVKNVRIVKHRNKQQVLVDFVCKCGECYSKTLDHILQDNQRICCKKCSTEIRGKNQRRKKDRYIETFRNYGYKIVELKYIPVRSEKIEVIDAEGYRGFASLADVLRGGHFEIFNTGINKKNFINNANNFCLQNHIPSKIIGFDDKVSYSTPSIRCQCGCGNEYTTSISSFKSGKTLCDECKKKQSRYSVVIEGFLKELQVEYIKEFRINSCRDILPLPFDFSIGDKLIEVDGEGHYSPCNFNQCSHENAKKSFEITKLHDKVKNDYCEKYGIKLLRIPYFDIKNEKYKESIINFIKE